MTPVRLTPDDDLGAVHTLLRQAFAAMDGVIDPPSSMTHMTLADLAHDAAKAELWVLPGPVACMILTYKGDTLYLGKLAVAEAQRGQGLARVMIEHSLRRARTLGLASVTLQTRVELTGNQAAFETMGFTEVERSAHPGFDRPTSITYRRMV